ncbi:hypothetical protein [Capnocytophaga stomatis]|uniref:hypothetical protein n=1 Tax=Capnocytophaga stomatis TaxID=1848904 RepID=UPI00194FBBD2|nr:hypothetical protein [Capnocytophaga stomatis]
MNIKKKDIELEELHEIFNNSPKDFYIKWFDGTKSKNHYEIEIRHNEGIDVKKEFFKELERIRKEKNQIQKQSTLDKMENKTQLTITQENNMKENTTKTDEVLNIYNNLNSETKNLLKQNFWAEQERHTNWHNSDYSDTREQDKLEKLFDNANYFIKAEYKEAKEKIFNTIEYTDFYEIVINNPNLKDNVNQEQKNKEFNLNSEQQQMVDEDINKIKKNVGMNARQAIEVNQEKTEDLLNSSIEMAKKFNISVLEAIDKKVQIYQRHSKSATESTAWQLRGDNAIKSYLNSLKETNNKEYMNTNNQNQEQNSAQNEQKEFNKVEYLKNQIKYLGFGESEQLHKNLEKGINSKEDSFVLHTTSDKVMEGNKVEFNLKFNKTEEGGVFFNSYQAKLTTKQGEERSHTFKVQKENNITAKEAINLLEGRAVKVHFNKTKEKIDEQTGEMTKEVTKEPSFIKLKLNEEKNEYGNYKLEGYSKNYGVDVNSIIEKANLVFKDDFEKENTIKHLEKGNITNVNFINDKKQQEKGFAILNPQWKMLNLYDEKMNRINSNKNAQTSELQDNQKNNVREQSNKRSL